MNEDYLWNKTGGDAEIEKLENALQTFRFRGGAPPAIALEIPPEKENGARRFFNFKFAFAFALSAAAVLVLFGIWFQLSSADSAMDDGFASITEDPVNGRIEKDKDADQPRVAPANEPQSPKRKTNGNVVPARHFAPEKPRAVKPTFRKTKNQEIVLTKEEKHAYDQLMLALSITSSKLKIVKDKIDGIEEQNARLTDEK